MRPRLSPTLRANSIIQTNILLHAASKASPVDLAVGGLAATAAAAGLLQFPKIPGLNFGGP